MNAKIENFIFENIDKTVRYSPESGGTLIGLPFPYTVPCVSDNFQEIYYWDTYFTNLGMILIGKTEYAKNNIQNMLYLVETYGHMPNGNRTYYLNRSQPPFLSRMVRDVFEQTKDMKWLRNAYGTLQKEYRFWQTVKTAPSGLNGYLGYEVLDSEIEATVKQFCRRCKLDADKPVTDEQKREICRAAFSMYESGWDCSARFVDRGHHINAVDLNALLYDMEENMRVFSEILATGEEALWQARKEERREKMKRLMWDEESGLFLDYNFKKEKISSCKTTASFYPLFAGLATKEEAAAAVAFLPQLESEFGVSCGKKEDSRACQWDYPNIWAPQQYIVYRALMNYGYKADALRIAEKYVKLIDTNYEKSGFLWEKYSCVTGGLADCEYKGQSYTKMLGWTAGVYLMLSDGLKKAGRA